MNINTAYPSTYLKASDLQGRRVIVTIARVDIEDVGDDTKPVVYFTGKTKGLVLNRTNAVTIAELLGSEETDDWISGSVVLFATKVDFQGRRVDAIRVDRPTEQAPPKKSALVLGNKSVPQSVTDVGELDVQEDIIPF